MKDDARMKERERREEIACKRVDDCRRSMHSSPSPSASIRHASVLVADFHSLSYCCCSAVHLFVLLGVLSSGPQVQSIVGQIRPDRQSMLDDFGRRKGRRRAKQEQEYADHHDNENENEREEECKRPYDPTDQIECDDGERIRRWRGGKEQQEDDMSKICSLFIAR